MRMPYFMLISGLVAFSTIAPAQQATPTTTSLFAVDVESLQIGSAKGSGLLESGASAGSYSMIVKQTKSSSFFLLNSKSTFTNEFRFLKDDLQLLDGSCTLKSEGFTMLSVDLSKNAQAYICKFGGRSDDQYTMQVDLPQFPKSDVGIGFLALSTSSAKEDAALQAILKARLIYRGATYDAAPTGFGKQGILSNRVVKGYVISRDGKSVGRVDFDGGTNHRGAINAPAADSDGREAVLFMALALNAMPDLYSPNTRSEILP